MHILLGEPDMNKIDKNRSLEESVNVAPAERAGYGYQASNHTRFLHLNQILKEIQVFPPPRDYLSVGGEECSLAERIMSAKSQSFARHNGGKKQKKEKIGQKDEVNEKDVQVIRLLEGRLRPYYEGVQIQFSKQSGSTRSF